MIEQTERPKKKRGFAAMDPARHREIASMGGLAADKGNKGHRFTEETARAAGKLGGCRDVERLRELGRAGGLARAANAAARKATEQAGASS